MLVLAIVEELKELDTRLFLLVNGAHTPLLDVCMHYVSHKFFWIPFYLFLLYLLFKNYGTKTTLLALVFTGLVIAVSDQVCLHLFKNVFLRYRPCHNALLQHKIHLVDACGGMYGFVSSHAANTFALAFFLFHLLKERYKWSSLLFVWAAFVSYSRVYLAQHYPADVAVGALVGLLAALLISKLYFYTASKLEHV